MGIISATVPAFSLSFQPGKEITEPGNNIIKEIIHITDAFAQKLIKIKIHNFFSFSFIYYQNLPQRSLRIISMGGVIPIV